MKGLRRALFMVSLPLFFINFILPLHARRLDASALEIGGLFSLFSVCVLLLRPLIGTGMDRLGRRRFFIGALLVYSLAYLIYAWAPSLDWLYAARLLQGIGAALLLISTDVITADLSAPGGQASAMGRNTEIQTRASLVGATIGFTLVGVVPALAWQWSFAIYAFAAVLAVIFALVWLDESRAADQLVKGETEDEPSKGFVDIGSQLQRLLLVVFLAGFGTALALPMYLIYLADHFQLPDGELAMAFLPAAFVMALLPSRTGRLADRYGHVGMLALGYVIAGSLYIALPYLVEFVWVVAAYTLASMGWALSDPARKALTVQFSRADNLGRGFGYVEFAAGLGAVAGPLVGGWLYDRWGALPVFAGNGLLLWFAAVMSMVLLRRQATVPAASN